MKSNKMNNKEQLILRISGIFVVLGLIIIYISSIFYNPKVISISEISSNLIGRTIRTYGNINYIKFKNNNLFLKISDQNFYIFVVKFNVHKNIFKIGQNITVEGKVNLYGGNLEIIANKMSLKKET